MPEKRRFKRGDIWTVSGGKDYAGKPRPAVVVQDNSFDGIDSVTICAFTKYSQNTNHRFFYLKYLILIN